MKPPPLQMGIGGVPIAVAAPRRTQHIHVGEGVGGFIRQNKVAAHRRRYMGTPSWWWCRGTALAKLPDHVRWAMDGR